jgi:hypothetical protein
MSQNEAHRSDAATTAGGRAAAAGAAYQAGVVAYVYAHVLSQARLGWFGLQDAVPVAVSAETGGPGDDVRIEFDGFPHVEIQAKHALTGGDVLRDILARIRDMSPRTDTAAVGLVVGRGSSRKFWEQIPDDIERLRGGRQAPLGDDVERLRGAFVDEVVSRLYVVAADFDRAEDPEPRVAQHLLRWVLARQDEVEAAWSALIEDAAQLSARGLRRTRKDLIDVLALRSIEVRPADPDDRWQRELDLIQQLLDAREAITTIFSISGSYSLRMRFQTNRPIAVELQRSCLMVFSVQPSDPSIFSSLKDFVIRNADHRLCTKSSNNRARALRVIGSMHGR